MKPVFSQLGRPGRNRQMLLRWAPVAVLVLSLLATAAVGFRAVSAGRARDEARFENAVQETRDAIHERIAVYAGILRSGAAMMSISGELDHEEFNQFVDRLMLDEFYPGIQGVGFAEQVLPEEVDEIMRRELARGASNFAIIPPGEREVYYPIVHLQPSDKRNQEAIGYDMFSDPVRNKAMSLARDTGMLAASGKVTLVQEIDEDVQAGFLIYAPVYEGGKLPETVEERREKLLGFFYSPFRTDDLFAGIFERRAQPRIHFEVFDGVGTNEENLLHRSPVPKAKKPLMEQTLPLLVEGHRWTLSLASTPAFEATSSQNWGRFILLGGVLLSVAFFGITRALARAVAGAETARQQAVSQREEYHVTLASIGDAVIATDDRGRIVFMNAVAEELTKWKESEARGKSLTERFRIVHDETHEPLPNPVEGVLATDSATRFSSHTVLLGPAREEKSIEDSAAPIRDPQGKLKGVVLVFRDVTAKTEAERERRQTERALARSESRFRLIFESAKDLAIFTFDRDGQIIHWNPGAEKIFGFSEEEILGRNVAELFSADDLAAGVPEEERRIAEETGSRMDERWLVRKDGSFFFASSAVRPVADAEGSFREFAKVVWDLTERKRSEEVLEQMVEERTTQLQKTVSELEVFSYSISHDLRAPLRAMQGYAQILEEEFSDRLDDTGQSYIQRIVAAGKRLDRLILDVLTYSRVSRAELVVSRIELEDLVRELKEQMPGLQEPAATLEIASPLPAVIGQESLLSQCLANLLGNAVKFVPPERKPRVVVRAETRGDRVRVWIEDNGIGIPAEQHDKVFRMFERVHSHGNFEGTGIGLAIVQKAIERMGGDLGLESEVGRGTRFWFELGRADS